MSKANLFYDKPIMRHACFECEGQARWDDGGVTYVCQECDGSGERNDFLGKMQKAQYERDLAIHKAHSGARRAMSQAFKRFLDIAGIGYDRNNDELVSITVDYRFTFYIYEHVRYSDYSSNRVVDYEIRVKPSNLAGYGNDYNSLDRTIVYSNDLEFENLEELELASIADIVLVIYEGKLQEKVGVVRYGKQSAEYRILQGVQEMIDEQIENTRE